jgi:tetratricopeptide (TPR) repeat protein
MKLASIRIGIVSLAALLAIGLALAPASFAQQGSSGQPPQQQPPKAAATGQASPAAAAQPPAEAPKVDPQEEAAYKTFFGLKAEETDKSIQQGEQFLQKYPTSKYAESVYSRLVQAYFEKQDMNKMYASADKALERNPNDVHVLVLVGWVIPHSYDPNDLNSDRRLDQAEGYEKHALQLLPSLAKPENLSDAEFAKARASAESQAHSGLGLIYFRRQQFPESVTEMQQAVKGSDNPDPVDLYILGVGLQETKRYSEAADAFHKCGQIPGGVQDRCKQFEGQAKKQAAAQPAPPKP